MRSPKKGRPEAARLSAEQSKAIRKRLADLRFHLREVSRALNERERWLEDAFARKDRVTGKALPLLRSDAKKLLRYLRERAQETNRSDVRYTYQELDAYIRTAEKAESEGYRMTRSAVPMLLLDDAIERFADEFRHYFQERGADVPTRSAIVQFFKRVDTPKGNPPFSYLELCAFTFQREACERAKRIRVSPDSVEGDDEYERPIHIAWAVATWNLLRKATPLEVRQHNRRKPIRSRVKTSNANTVAKRVESGASAPTPKQPTTTKKNKAP